MLILVSELIGVVGVTVALIAWVGALIKTARLGQ
jgi:hypothetical protein